MHTYRRKLVAACLAVSIPIASLTGCVAVPPPTAMVPGQPLPPAYQGDAYAVNDWRAQGLYEPPPGYGWRYVDGQYVLVAVATGIIAATVLGALLGHGGGGPRFGPR